MTKSVPDPGHSTIFQRPPTRHSSTLSLSSLCCFSNYLWLASAYIMNTSAFFNSETKTHCSALSSRNYSHPPPPHLPTPISTGMMASITVCMIHEYAKFSVATADNHSDGIIINSDHSCDPLHVQWIYTWCFTTFIITFTPAGFCPNVRTCQPPCFVPMSEHASHLVTLSIARPQSAQ